MCTAPPHCQCSGPTILVGLHSAQTCSSVHVVPSLLLPSTGQCQFLQPLLEARTEEETWALLLSPLSSVLLTLME